ncbi:hypothetical protein Tco_0677320 [Tanacetum coccineum]|uniref:Uncharacterized protein n=1 Tax=Tanacetum coccineum TaxID=301880 RepID=A0ABQ4XBY0_9ASTR
MPTEMELTLEQTQQGVSYEVSDFQESSDDEVDERTTKEYLRDLDIEFHKRALLAGLAVGKNHTRNSEWIDITMRKLTKASSKNDVKENPFITSSMVYDHEMILKSKDWVERHNPDSKLPNFNTKRILVPESQAVNECLGLTEAPIDLKSSKELGSEPLTPLPLLKNLQGVYPSFEVMPMTYQDHSPRERHKEDRTLMEAARTMLEWIQYSIEFWTEALRIACYTENKSIIIKRHDKTTYEIFRERISDISYFHVSACPVFIHNHKDHLSKFDAKETYHVTFVESMEAIRFTNTSVDEIGIDDSSRYPHDEFLHEDDPSR